MKSASRSVIIIFAVLAGVWLVQGLEAQSPEQQVVSEVAQALGGRDRILAVRTLLLEGQGKDFSFGQGARPDDMGSQSDPWKVTGYRRAYDLTADRAQSVQGIDGTVAYNVGETGNATRVWGRQEMAARRVEMMRHPLIAVRAALDPAAKVTNARTQGSERLVDVTLPSGPTVTLAL